MRRIRLVGGLRSTNRNVIVLIDEYDVPLQSAFLHGYYDEMLAFLRTLMSSAFKTETVRCYGIAFCRRWVENAKKG